MAGFREGYAGMDFLHAVKDIEVRLLADKILLNEFPFLHHIVGKTAKL
jgi:hypothetical protein